MYQKGILTINEWPNGVADSATLGFSAVNNCEIFETPGTLKIAPASVLAFPTYSPDSLPIAFAEDLSGNIYFLSQAGTLYRTAGGVLYGLQSGLVGAQDIIFYRDYIWVSYGNPTGIIGLYGPTSGGASWFGSWRTTSSDAKNLTSEFKRFVVPQNDNLYMSNGKNVVYVSGFVGAAAFVTPTPITPVVTGWNIPGSFTNVGGTIVSSQNITAMVEYGTNLLMGTSLGKMYRWDMADTQLVDVPFTISSGSIKQMITKENRVYITSGLIGDVYVGDGTNFQKLQRIKWRQRRPFGATISLLPNAIAISPTGTLLVGTSTASDSFPSTSLQGIHEILLQGQSNGTSVSSPTCFKHTISTGNTGQNQALYIGFIGVSGSVIYVGWQDGSTYGFDVINQSGAIYTTATAESMLYPIASSLDKVAFSKLEIRLATPLITGQSVSIAFRNNLTTAYDNPRVFSYTSMGPANSTFPISASLSAVDQLQAKVTLTSPAGVGLTNVELLGITIW